jgi:diguanylate cyclase (GGDEF)-like protein
MEEDEQRALSYLHDLGHYDPLTRVYNRRYLTQHLASELAFAERHETSLSIILLDIDHFKAVNDDHGHQAGDRVLETVAALAAAQIRTEDVIARYGGEEFMIVLRGTPVVGAEVLAERVRRQVSQTAIEIAGGPALHVTLCAGCASLECTGGIHIDELIRLADQRLYRAKGAGRNRVVGSARALPSH